MYYLLERYPGPYLRTDKVDICPEPTGPRGPPVTTTNYVIYSIGIILSK